MNVCFTVPSAIPVSHGHASTSSPTPFARHRYSSLREIFGILRAPLVPLPDHSSLVFHHTRFTAGQYVYRTGQRFDSLYIVNSGFLKTVLLHESGIEQVLSFPMQGDLLGIDGMHSGQYACEAIALSDCDIITVPFQLLSTLARTYPQLELAIYSAISQKLIQEQALAYALASLGAEARIARFLVSMSERFASMGYSGKLFNLRMTRREIGRYLGTSLETACRTLSAFSELGWITVDKRTIGILDLQALKTVRRLPAAYSRSRHRTRRAKTAALAHRDA